jgi:hypothetical protein
MAKIDSNGNILNAEAGMWKSPELSESKLIDLLSLKVDRAQIISACLSYRHDFGLMEGKKRHELMQEAVWWLEAWQKAMATR